MIRFLFLIFCLCLKKLEDKRQGKTPAKLNDRLRQYQPDGKLKTVK